MPPTSLPAAADNFTPYLTYLQALILGLLAAVGLCAWGLGRRAARRERAAASAVLPNEALQLPGMQGRPAAPLGSIWPRHRRAPKARS